MMNRDRYKKSIVIGVLFIVALLVLRKTGVGSYFSLKKLQEHSSWLRLHAEQDYVMAAIIYVLVYTILVASSLPVTGPMSILGGYLFYTIPGTVLGLTGATLGSTLSFLFIRYVISNAVRERYKDQLENFNEKIKQYGYTYLLTLQLLAVVPFFVTNTLAALTGVPIFTFIWTTAVGSLPILFIYSLAGRELATLTKVGDIFKPHIMFVLLLMALLALLPMIIKRFRKLS